MKTRPDQCETGTQSRSRKTTAVTNPRLTVTEGTTPADPAALDDALDLLITWAIRRYEAQKNPKPTPEGPITDKPTETCTDLN